MNGSFGETCPDSDRVGVETIETFIPLEALILEV